MPTTIDIGGFSTIGARQKQEDCFMGYTLTETLPKAHNYYIVNRDRTASIGILGDGMGGEGDGSICSRFAVQAFGEAFAETGSFNTFWFQRLRMSLYSANAAITEFKKAVGSIDSNSGTTLVAAVISEGSLHYVSVGDSSLYLFRPDNRGYYKGERINRLHIAWAHYYKEDGQLYKQEVTEEEAKRINAARTPVSYCKPMGMYCALCGREIGYMDCSPEEGIPLRDGDVLMLCSDGVSDTLNSVDMDNTVYNYSERIHSASQLAYEMIQKVLEASLPKQDNASCIVFKVHID